MSIFSEDCKILIVDDDSWNLDLISRILTRANFQVDTAIDGIDAICKIKKNLPELILLDGIMPKLDGFETCHLLKQDSMTKGIPIIFMSALVEQEKKVKAFKLGVSDYITKPFQKAELLARVEYQLELVNLRYALETKNKRLEAEINQKYEAELSLLNTNEQLSNANQTLIAEIENRKAIEIKLQQEIVERQIAEKQVKKSLQEKELLLKEIHHRVKNNLYIVSSLLESQKDYIIDSQLIKILENSRSRIMSMALIHEQLYGDFSLFQIDFQQYIITLTDYSIDSYFTDNIAFKITIPQIYLNIETANPCGLIINELISNAVEHAFVGRERGKIALDFQENSHREFSLIIKDDGIGFPEYKDFFNSESLGLELVVTLVEQLEGQIEMNNSNGTEIKITFKELNYKNRI